MKQPLLLLLAGLLLMPLTAIHAADDLSGDRVTAGALGLSQSPLPALHTIRQPSTTPEPPSKSNCFIQLLSTKTK
jgi:hypothetical protein